MTKIILYYDCVSPYSWLAFEFLVKNQKNWNYQLVLKPMYLGGVMKASENQPPGLNIHKANYMIKDLERTSKLYGFKIKQHPKFGQYMFESLAVMRLVSSVQLNAEQFLEKVSRALWERLWQNEEEWGEKCFDDVLQMLPQELRGKVKERFNTKETKDHLKKNTDECIALGAFGAPVYVVEKDGKKEWFYGSDRWEQLAYFLGKNYPPTPKL